MRTETRLTGPVSPAVIALATRRIRARKAATRFERLPLYRKQAAMVDFHTADSSLRFMGCEGTTKSGKTMSLIEKFGERGFEIGHGEHWWVAPVSSQAEMAMRRFCDRLRGFISQPNPDYDETDPQSPKFIRKRIEGWKPIPFKPNWSKGVVTITGFSLRFCFKSAEKPDNLYGEDVLTAMCDEISRWREDAWTAVYSTLSSSGGLAWLIGNVKGRKNFAYKLMRKAEAGAPGWSYFKLTADDAMEGGILRRDVVEQAKRDLPHEIFRELYYAEATEDGSNPFGLSAIKACIGPLSDLPPVAFGVDLAKSSDWTVIIGLDKFGAVCRYARYQRSWNDTERDIKQRIGFGHPSLIDSTGVGDPIVERLSQEHPDIVGFKFTGPSKQQLMEGLAVGIQNHEITFPDDAMIAEFSNTIVTEASEFEYEYTRTGTRYSAPEGLHDDAVCALALAYKAFVEMPRPFEPPSLGDGVEPYVDEEEVDWETVSF